MCVYVCVGVCMRSLARSTARCTGRAGMAAHKPLQGCHQRGVIFRGLPPPTHVLLFWKSCQKLKSAPNKLLPCLDIGTEKEFKLEYCLETLGFA